VNRATLYYETILEQLHQVRATQGPAIEEVAGMFAACLLEERRIYLFGTGHAHMLAEELFYRAGGIARIHPILHPPLMLHESAHASTRAERDLAVVDELLETYPIDGGDLLLIASNSGINPVPIELASRARVAGARVIGLVNRRHCAAFASRHPTGRKLPDLCDLTIDNCGVAGDACVPIGVHGVIGAASTVTGATILQMIACRSVQLAVEQGWEAELFSSANVEGDEVNDTLVERIRGEIRHL
jgi:uncharacterized phosphosugar-binding protein